ncbi:formate--tetrahydrofolate ligase [Corynebacterium ulceribovis]|uniref:formate--tetrahydrofolate ligase n=1 Tax=Corynebacterium ulceribovis TaxID=487732 RepID=UPI0003601052|nr:formate--tetrahydrofolate ligase [Corynebacterium ulceribovis]
MSASQPSDIDIAAAHQLLPMSDIARRAGLPDDTLIPYGRSMAKVDLAAAQQQAPARRGKLILVTATSPTPAGEGKSTVLIGLADALTAAGKRSIVTLREPSQGPVMGIKGGAAGGGYAQIVPMADINLHFTGDFHAITAATNTLAALIDNHIQHGNALNIDPCRITWRRCLDVNDRSLRNIITGLGGPGQGTPREAGFDITAASEIMAVLCLATDMADLRARLGRIVIGSTYSRVPVTVSDLGVAGALAALMRDAMNPNLVQTLGGTPALVHGGPFANIAHGCNSLVATTTALDHADYVLTEAGFGSDLGAEKFFDITARAGELQVAAAVVVTTIRSIKFNGGADRTALTEPDLDALADGLVNVQRHCENIRQFGVEPVIALNLFTSDTEAEREYLRQWAREHHTALAETTVWADGGAGAAELAETVLATMADHAHDSHPIYDPGRGLLESLQTIAQRIYGASGVQLSAQAEKDLLFLRANGWDTLPVCVSKTQYSFSDDPTKLGAPTGHTLNVRSLVPRIGAGFIVALTGDVMTLPGLPKQPAANGIDIDELGQISGLF